MAQAADSRGKDDQPAKVRICDLAMRGGHRSSPGDNDVTRDFSSKQQFVGCHSVLY